MSEVLGALFAILVGLMYYPKIANGVATERHTQTDVTTAIQQQQWVAAVSNYVTQNMTSLESSVTTTPTVIPVATVKAANVGLPVGFTGTNPFNQTWTAAVTQPTAGNLQVLIYTVGGTQINDQELGSIARSANGVGGMIPTNNSGVYSGGAATAYGAFGAWQVSTAAYGVTGGSPASLLTFSNGALTSNYLYRNAVPGQPQLNTMSTNLNMGGNTITNAQQIQLAAGNGVQIGNSYVYGDSANTALRQNGAVYLQNTAGTANADLIAGNITAGGNVWAAGYLHAQGDVSANGNVSASGNVSANGNLWTNQQVIANGTIISYAGASAGSGCSQNGAIANSGSGPLFCQSGVWTAGGVSSVVQVDSGGWSATGYAGCPGGYTLTGGSCDMNRGGDGREISPRICQPSGNGFSCAENNSGSCIAHAICVQ
ncbi:shufflon system plasmid conjugative transfer pilus tip adhesin PilV [Trinickia terrae]|uniref:Shufflon system plasmid conjugative transfer pilus tip adhesin PilV n=1 Tax=Trinickia terrae TaxID=2571161 RepID=A0A4U1I9H3_9BURK|nr:shufflon system plasmid conjugative transfer pilus tip adhesin PilV [Trinickia terrae]TKC90139.1 shufflon system plasmid conjugative transfer pilus tip adhesin PilV [Trinickia terrae]